MCITPGETATPAAAASACATEPVAAGPAATELESPTPDPAAASTPAVSPHAPTATTIRLDTRIDVSLYRPVDHNTHVSLGTSQPDDRSVSPAAKD
jgi:hypothetical protein